MWLIQVGACWRNLACYFSRHLIQLYFPGFYWSVSGIKMHDFLGNQFLGSTVYATRRIFLGTSYLVNINK